MTLERKVRVLAGSLIVIGLFLYLVWSPYWLFLDLFVGLNLFQSAFTRFCPAEKILARIGSGPAEETGGVGGTHPTA